MAKKVQKSASEQLIEEIQTLGQTQGLNNVFTTFLEMLAVSLNAQVDPRYAEEREKRYQQMVSGMSQEMLSTYARMFALMYMAVKEHSEEPSDILGSIYHRLGLNNEWNGQFFTDDHICRMMAMPNRTGRFWRSAWKGVQLLWKRQRNTIRPRRHVRPGCW